MLIVDHFTKFVQGYVTRNKSGHNAAERLFNEYVPSFGSQAELFMTRDGNLRIRCLSDLAS